MFAPSRTFVGGIPGYCFLGGFGENGALRGR